MPQLPQFWESVRRFLHVPLQLVCPGGQVHAPFWHAKVGGPALPQLPQFCGSLVRLVHAPLHQVWPLGQALPQAPQFAGSLRVLWQAPEQQDDQGAEQPYRF